MCKLFTSSFFSIISYHGFDNSLLNERHGCYPKEIHANNDICFETVQPMCEVITFLGLIVSYKIFLIIRTLSK